MHKAYIIGGAVGACAVIVVCILLAFAYHHEFSETDACSVTTQSATSPSGQYRAEMQNKQCRWGFGFAANSVQVKVERLGKGGWFYTVAIKYDGFYGDQGLPAPTMKWNGANSLVINVHSHDISGSLARVDGELSVVQHYIQVSR